MFGKQVLGALALVALLAGCGGGGGGTSPVAVPTTNATPTPTPVPSTVGITVTITKPTASPTPFLLPVYTTDNPLFLSRTLPWSLSVYSTLSGLTLGSSNPACATGAQSSPPPTAGFTFGVTITATPGAPVACNTTITITVGGASGQSGTAYVIVP